MTDLCCFKAAECGVICYSSHRKPIQQGENTQQGAVTLWTFKKSKLTEVNGQPWPAKHLEICSDKCRSGELQSAQNILQILGFG